jgi:hypothetical protein
VENREPRRRVILLTTDGVHRIIGTFDPSVHEVRQDISFGLTRAGHTLPVQAKLVAVEPRYVLYRQEADHAGPA